MSLEILLLNSIEDRTKYLKEEINKGICDKDKKLLLVVPEQFNFSCQKTVLDFIDEKAITNLEILSPNRLIHRIYEETGYEEKSITKADTFITIYKILEDNNNFKFINRYKNRIRAVNEISNIINILVKSEIMPSEIYSVMTSTSSILKDKLNDIYEVYDSYIKKLKEDEINVFESYVVSNLIGKTDYLKNASIYISEFYNFNSEQLHLIKILTDICDVKVVLQAKGTEDVKFDPYMLVKKSINKLTQIKEGAIVNNTLSSSGETSSKGQLCYLKNNYFDPSAEALESADDIYFDAFDTKKEEVLNIALSIINLVKNKGYRYKDITVVAKDLNEYSLLIGDIFTQFDINFCLEDKESFYNSKLFELIESIMNCIISNRASDFINLVKLLRFSKIEKYEVDILENQSFKNGYEYISDVRFEKNILDEIRDLIYKYGGGSLPIKEYVSDINRIITNYLKNYYKDEWKKELEIFNDLSASIISIDKSANFLEFFELFKSIAQDINIQKIPRSIDEVSIFSKERVNIISTKVLFIAGYSDEKNLLSNTSNFFSEKETSVLISNGIEISKKFIDMIVEDKFLFYNMIDKVSDRLYISYINGKNGTELKPDKKVIDIIRLFKNLESFKEENFNIYKDLLINDKVVFLYYSYYMPSSFSKFINDVRDINKLKEIAEFNKKKDISVSEERDDIELSFTQLETYSKCPFAYYITYMLKVKERDEAEIDAKDLGSIIHELLDKVFKRIIDEKLDVLQTGYDEIKSLTNSILTYEIRINKINFEKNKYLIERLKDILSKNIFNFILQLRQGNFKVSYTEVKFGKDDAIKSSEYILDNGKKIYLRGVIDRVDTFEADGKTYIKVIDYKTGSVNFNIQDIEYGLNMQLLVYLSILIRNLELNAVPAGIFLSRVDFDMKKDDGKEIKDNKLMGIVLDNEVVQENMDRDYKNSKILPIKFNKDGTYSSLTKRNIANEEDFNDLMIKVEDKIKEIGSKIIEGDISVRPLDTKKHDACKFCSYSEICNIEEFKS